MALATDIAGIDVKSGRESNITENTTRAVVFNTPFESGPVHIVIGFAGPSNQQSTCNAFNRSINGFTIEVRQLGTGTLSDRRVFWVATNAGNP